MHKDKGAFMKSVKLKVESGKFNMNSGAFPRPLGRGLGRGIKAFTLAEVLITLGVIGVVTAITMPTLINKYQEHVTVNKVKKFYSMMSQAILLSINENGYPNEWNVTDGSTRQSAIEITNYIKPYVKVIKDCATNSGCLNYTNNVKLLNGNISGSNYDTSPGYYKMILSDGSYLMIRGTTGTKNYCQSTDDGVENVCGVIYTDINGGKEPNTVGKDIFDIYITTSGIKPNMAGCDMTGGGWGCINYILTNGNMNYPAAPREE